MRMSWIRWINKVVRQQMNQAFLEMEDNNYLLLAFIDVLLDSTLLRWLSIESK